MNWLDKTRFLFCITMNELKVVVTPLAIESDRIFCTGEALYKFILVCSHFHRYSSTFTAQVSWFISCFPFSVISKSRKYSDPILFHLFFFLQLDLVLLDKNSYIFKICWVPHCSFFSHLFKHGRVFLFS